MAVTALSISRSLVEALKRRPFAGRVIGRFERACNLVDTDGRIVALTLPEVGNGPFAVVVDGRPGCFDSLAPAETATANSNSLNVGPLRLDLNAAPAWEACLACPTHPLTITPAFAGIIQPYTHWPDSAKADAMFTQRLAQTATRLNRAVTQAKGVGSAGEAAAAAGQLAGLGPGLTPAGDDFLLGVMVALWLVGPRGLLSPLAAAAIPRTTALSAAFLRAAAQGEFIEPWHTLAQALAAGEVELFRRAVQRVAHWGASSGRDALAGFATTILAQRLI